MDVLSQLSISLASKIAAAAPSVVALALGEKRRTATIWRPGLIVASEQTIGEDAGAAHYITKPFTPKDLVAQVREFLGE